MIESVVSFSEDRGGIEFMADKRPTATYYTINKRGEQVSMELPADPYSMQTYLRKGFVLDSSKLKKGVN